MMTAHADCWFACFCWQPLFGSHRVQSILQNSNFICGTHQVHTHPPVVDWVLSCWHFSYVMGCSYVAGYMHWGAATNVKHVCVCVICMCGVCGLWCVVCGVWCVCVCVCVLLSVVCVPCVVCRPTQCMLQHGIWYSTLKHYIIQHMSLHTAQPMSK